MIVEKLAVAVGHKIPRYVLETSNISEWTDHLTGAIAHQLTVFLASNTTTKEDTNTKTTDTSTVEVPETWWDHTKERFAPRWFLARYPVAYRKIVTMRSTTTTTTTRTTNICPHIELPKSDSTHFEFLLHGDLPR